jgi:hypothetical protein
LEGDPAVLEYEDKLVLVKKENDKKVWTLKDFEGKIIQVSNNAESRAFQMLLKRLGLQNLEDTASGKLCPLPCETFNRYYIILNGNLLGTIKSQPNETMKFYELGIEPIDKIISKEEFLNTSVLVENKEEDYFLIEKLAKGFNISYNSGALPYLVYPKYFNISNNSLYTTSATSQFPIGFTIQEFGYPYKNTFEKGDRFVWKDGLSAYIYDNPDNGKITYLIDFNEEGELFTRYMYPTKAQTDVEWKKDTLYTKTLLKNSLVNGEAFILANKPKYFEGFEIPTAKIIAVGFDSKTMNFVYQVYLKTKNEVRRFNNEADLESFLELSTMVDWLEEKEKEREEKSELKIGDIVEIQPNKSFPEKTGKMGVVRDVIVNWQSAQVEVYEPLEKKLIIVGLKDLKIVLAL